MEAEEYLSRLNLQPPIGMLDWMAEKFQTEYLIYHCEYERDYLSGEKTKAVRVTCTACGESWHADYAPAAACGYSSAPFGFYNREYSDTIFTGRSTICPNCGHTVTGRHIGSFGRRNEIEQNKWAMSIGRIDDNLVLYGWIFKRLIGKQADSRIEASPYEAYVFEEKKTLKYVGYRKNYTTVILNYAWSHRKQCIDTWNESAPDMIFPFSPAILMGSTVENSKLDVYIHEAGADVYPVQYLRTYQKHHNIENLIVQGASRVINTMIERECRRYGYERAHGAPKLPGIDWKKNRPSEMLGISPEAMRTLKAQRWSLTELNCYKKITESETIKLPEDMEMLRKFAANSVLLLAEADQRGNVSMMRCLRYLDKQKAKSKGEQDWAMLLRDYWRLADHAGRDLNDISAKLPRSLRFSHDSAIQEIERMRIEKDIRDREKAIIERADKFEARRRALEPYAWEKDNLIIRACTDERELIREGETLHHCVARYAGDICAGKTAIFFVRNKERADVPFYTLELDEGELKVRQNRGAHNCARTPEVQEFENAWIEHLKRKMGIGEKTA